MVKSKFGKDKGYNNPSLNMRHGLDGSTLGATHPNSSNPGDVITTGSDYFRPEGSSPQKYERGYGRCGDHPLGSNPGDVFIENADYSNLSQLYISNQKRKLISGQSTLDAFEGASL